VDAAACFCTDAMQDGKLRSMIFEGLLHQLGEYDFLVPSTLVEHEELACGEDHLS
jgi:hypothetical protein